MTFDDCATLQQWLEWQTADLRRFQQCRRSVVHEFVHVDENGIRWPNVALECGHWMQRGEPWSDGWPLCDWPTAALNHCQVTCRECAKLYMLFSPLGQDAIAHFAPRRFPPGTCGLLEEPIPVPTHMELPSRDRRRPYRVIVPMEQRCFRCRQKIAEGERCQVTDGHIYGHDHCFKCPLCDNRMNACTCVSCATCNGSGRIGLAFCGECDGEGWHPPPAPKPSFPLASCVTQPEVPEHD